MLSRAGCSIQAAAFALTCAPSQTSRLLGAVYGCLLLANAYPASLPVGLCAILNTAHDSYLWPLSFCSMLSLGLQLTPYAVPRRRQSKPGLTLAGASCLQGSLSLCCTLRLTGSRPLCAVHRTTTCCRSTSGLSLADTGACRPPVPLPRILSHGLQEREFHVHSEPVRQGLNKALGELFCMTASLRGTALQEGLQQFQGQNRVAAGIVNSALRVCGCIVKQQNPQLVCVSMVVCPAPPGLLCILKATSLVLQSSSGG